MRTLEEEAFRWLTERGRNEQHLGYTTGARNRPVLMKMVNGIEEIITMKEAKTILNFKSVMVYQSQVKINGCRIEDEIQTQIHHLGLPYRLHRHVAKGNTQQSDAQLLDPDYLHQVFITYSSFADVMENAKMKVVVIP